MQRPHPGEGNTSRIPGIFNALVKGSPTFYQPKFHLIEPLLNWPDVKIQQKTGRSWVRFCVPPASGPQNRFTPHWTDGGSSLTKILTTTLVACCQKTPYWMDQDGSAKNVDIPVRQIMRTIFAPNF